MQIKIIAVGKLDRSMQDIAASYIRKISEKHNLEIVEIKAENDADPQQAIKIESGRILDQISPGDCVVLYDILGEDSSRRIRSKALSKSFKIVFIIGGSNGVGERVQKRANALQSFSSLTFPHKLFRLIALDYINSSY